MTGPITAYQVARDPDFLALVCEALVAVSHERVRTVPMPAPGESFSDDLWFAVRAGASPETFQHAAALAMLSTDDAPSDPYDSEWLVTRAAALWPTLSVVCRYGMTP